MKYFILLVLISMTISTNLFAEKYQFEEVSVTGVENPICITLSPDGSKMIIVDWPKKGLPVMKQSNRPYLESKWGAADEIASINKLIDKTTRIDGPCVSFDGQRLYFAANFAGSIGGMDIYYCTLTDDGWSEPINLGAPINTVGNENFPSVSGNNRSLFFTRELEMKKLDDFRTGEIWVSHIDTTETSWKSPEKLNTEINNGGIAYPKIYDDNKTLFYSQVNSEKEGWKIYWVKRYTDLHWYLPVKMDTLASKDNEISPFFCKQDKQLYYIVSDGGNHPNGTIYRYPVEQHYYPDKTIVVKGKVINQLTNKPLVATIKASDPILGKIDFFTQSDINDGSWRMLLNTGADYMFHVFANTYTHQYKLIPAIETTKEINIDFGIVPKVEVVLNMYDEEELWPLNGTITIKNEKEELLPIEPELIFKGQKKLVLPIGANYTISVSAKDYFDNQLDLNLTGIVLFDKFERDIELMPVKRDIELFVTDRETTNPLIASIEIFDRRKELFVPDPAKGKIGLYEITLREGEYFDIEVRGPKGFAFKHTQIDLNADRDLKRMAIELNPLTRKVPIRLNNINFEFNSADLMESSFPELDRVIQLLKDNPDIHIEIMAHTDDVGSDKYNYVLADKRAKSVVEYMVINGVDAERLVAKGYGEQQPLVPNTSDANRTINRRVEMKIFDEDDKEFYIEERVAD